VVHRIISTFCFAHWAVVYSSSHSAEFAFLHNLINLVNIAVNIRGVIVHISPSIVVTCSIYLLLKIQMNLHVSLCRIMWIVSIKIIRNWPRSSIESDLFPARILIKCHATVISFIFGICICYSTERLEPIIMCIFISVIKNSFSSLSAIHDDLWLENLISFLIKLLHFLYNIVGHVEGFVRVLLFKTLVHIVLGIIFH